MSVRLCVCVSVCLCVCVSVFLCVCGLLRVEAQTKMTMLKEKAVKDLVQYSAEMKELERVIAHERRLKEFMSTKCNERSTQDEGQDIGSKQGVCVCVCVCVCWVKYGNISSRLSYFCTYTYTYQTEKSVGEKEIEQRDKHS